MARAGSFGGSLNPFGGGSLGGFSAYDIGSNLAELEVYKVEVAWGNGTATQNITWDVVNTDGSSNVTQFAATSSSNSTFQDGYGSGTLQSLSVDQNGIISGTFTNGQVIPLAQVALSSFNNNNGLVQSANNTWAQSLASGTPTIGVANTGGRGSILGSNLELSNVDMATEFTNLILAQNGYQANSKAITTTNALLQATLNMVQ